MRILMLTWEFPPVITGGLGMACYGMAKALLKQGHQVDVVMPVKQEVYFPLRKIEDADCLPVTFADPAKQCQMKNPLSAEDLRKLIGSPLSVYYTPRQSTWARCTFEDIKRIDPFKRLFNILADDSYLFQQVRNYTTEAISIASWLDFDIIHAHDWLTYPAAMAIRRLSGKPLVLHVHATEFDRAGGPGDRRIHDVEFIGMNYADRVVAVSAYTANLVNRKYMVSPQKTRVVHNAYSLTDSSETHRRIFDEPTVLFMGRITLQKGPDYFLEVARRVLQHNKKVRFIMAGSGDMERHILHHSAYLGMGTKFLFAGFLQRDEVEQILSTSDIFILPSVSEPFGIAPLEAMNKGAVAIISKNAGVAEVIKNAYKIDFWDIEQMVATIIELLDNPARLKEIAKLGSTEVANMRWESAVDKLINVFYELEPSSCLT